MAERGRRADAQRSIDALVDAAIRLLSHDPTASVQQIAEAAGVARVTAYGHFPSRAALVEAALEGAIARGETAMAAVDLDGEPLATLELLIRTSWQLSAESRNIWIAAQNTLDATRIRALHAAPAARTAHLLQRGQRADVFRRDLPNPWLIEAVHALMNLALAESTQGNLTRDAAADALSRSVAALWSPPPPAR